MKCTTDAFPFAIIDDDVDYVNALFIHNFGYRSHWSIINNAEQLNLISRSLKVDKDLDASRHCLNWFKTCKYVTESEFNSTIKHQLAVKFFSILHINARSLIKNLDNILLFKNGLSHKFSVIAVTETWTNEDNEQLVDIAGYNKIIKHREVGKGGGVALYIDSDLRFTPATELAHFIAGNYDSVFANIYLSTYKTVTVGAIYRPPGTDIKTFNDSLTNLLKDSKFRQNKIFLAVDYNINLLNNNSHNETHNFLNIMYDYKFYPLITHPTRFSHTGSTLIDNIFTNCMEEDYQTGIILSDVSDHLPVFYVGKTDIIKSNENNKPKIIKSRIFDQNRILGFAQELQLANLLNIGNDNGNDINICYNSFHKTFMQLYNEFFPVITKQLKEGRINSKPWFASSLNKSVQKR